MLPDDLLDALAEAADEWQAAPHGSVAEQDAAGAMYGAIQALLERVAPREQPRAA